jgi:hypothetical protein
MENWEILHQFESLGGVVIQWLHHQGQIFLVFKRQALKNRFFEYEAILPDGGKRRQETKGR